jgi:hypothetical protein
MSVHVDCPSCAFGKHDRHDRDWGIKPGLIGGQSCGCTGDCPERWAAATEEFARRYPFPEEPA